MKYKDNWIDQAIRYKIIIDHINKYAPKKILEIGSWSKWISRFFDAEFDWLDLSRKDYKKEEWCEEKEFPSNMNFIRWSALDIPIKDNTYDLAFSCDMIEHIKKADREKIFLEAIRVCKNWWYVIILFPCWLLWKIFDHFLFHSLNILNLFNKKISAPAWIKEHSEIEYPTNKEISKIVKKIKEQHDVEVYNVNNIFVHAVSILIDISRFQKIKDKVIDYYLNKRVSHNNKSIFPYRKCVIINKR